MATAADFTTRTRDEMFSVYVEYVKLKARIDAIGDEVDANGGAQGLYGVGGADFPEQADGFTYADMVAAFQAITILVGDPTQTQQNAIIKARR